MLNISPKTKAAVIASSLALLGSVAATVGIWYMIERSDVRLAAVENATAQLVEEGRLFTALETQAEQTAEERAELEQYILTQSEFVEFLSLLENSGARFGVEVVTKSIETDGATTKDGFEIVAVTSELTGSFAALRELIELYEQLPYQLHIGKASFDRMGDEGNEWRSSVVLKVTKATL